MLHRYKEEICAACANFDSSTDKDSPFIIIESPLSPSRMHWDHEPRANARLPKKTDDDSPSPIGWERFIGGFSPA
jgi:hypothetical protein